MKIDRSPELLSRCFQKYSGNKIPSDYLSKGRCFVFYEDHPVFVKVIFGGFAIIDRPPFRTHIQIPNSNIEPNICNNEITAYFIDDFKKGIWITLRLIIEVLKSKGPFVYSYDKDNLRLEKYYSRGNPTRIYSGQVINLDGMSGLHIENVEILKKNGILTLFTKRTMKGFQNAFKTSKKNNSK